MVELHFREGKALLSKEGKAVGSELCREYRELRKYVTACDGNYDIDVGRAAVEGNF
jgi:hypothetical protein